MICKCGFANNVDGVTLKCKQCGEAWPPKGHETLGGPQRGDTKLQQREHVLVAAGAPPFVLTPGKDVIIGRGAECALSIPSGRVSRQHARITWREGLPVLEHLSESSPTLVNGQVVKTHELRAEDELQIGPWRCTYRGRGASAPAGKPAEPLGGLTVADQGAALVGSLSVFSLVELLRDYERQEKTGTLTLTGADQDGFLVFEAGCFVSAELGKLTGEEAAFALLTWDEGMFSFSAEKRSATKKIIRSFDYSAVGPSKQAVQKIPISTLLERAAQRGATPRPGPAAPTTKLPPSPRAAPPPGRSAPPQPSRPAPRPGASGEPPRRPPGAAGGPPPARPRPGPTQPPGR